MGNPDFRSRMHGAFLLVGLNLTEAAKKMNVAPSTMSRKIKDPSSWRWDEMVRLGKVIGRKRMMSIFFPSDVADSGQAERE